MVTVSISDILPHLRSTLFISGSFVIAWSWDLCLYSVAHVIHGENPLQEQLGFGNQLAPQYLTVLVLEYLIVCGFAAYTSYLLRRNFHSHMWCSAAIMAVEFFPSPFFAGKLMVYLGKFKGLSELDQVLVHFLAAAFAAFLTYAFKDSGIIEAGTGMQLPEQVRRFPDVLADTLGFGLGISWNILLGQLLAPVEMNAAHVIGIIGYLLVVLLFSFKLAALDKGADGETRTTTQQDQAPSSVILQRTISLLSFAFNVVSAFTLVAFVDALLNPEWSGAVASLFVLHFLAAVLSAMVAAVETDNRSTEQRVEDGDEQKYGFGTCFALDVLVFFPCTWFCCPWVPLAWLLMGVIPDVHVKERWYHLIAFVLGLAASIQAASMLTRATNALALAHKLCGPKHCHHPWRFLGLQVLIGIVTTALLLSALAYVSDPVEPPVETHTQSGQGERQPLLGSAKNLLPKFITRKGRNGDSSNTEDTRTRKSFFR